jgi:predicted Zn-dependent peptidase
MQETFDVRFESSPVADGVTLHARHDPKFKTAVVKIFVATDLEEPRATEIALLPSVLRRGTRQHPTQRALTRHLESLYGTQLGGDILKIGEEQVISFKLEVPGDFFLPAGKGAFSPALETLRALVLDPALQGDLFPAPVVQQEKEKQRQFIDALVNDKGVYAAERCGREMCQGERFAVYEYGSVDRLAVVTPESLTKTWRELVANAPIDVYVMGSFDGERAKDAVKKAFALERGQRKRLAGTTRNPERRAAREIRELMPVKQGKLCMGLRSEQRLEDDGYFALIVMNGVLGAFAHSKLFRNVREKAGLCYYASSSLERTKGLVFIQSGIEKANFEKARDLSLEQLEAMRRGEISDEEIESTRRAARLTYRSLLDKPAQLANMLYILKLAGRALPLHELASRVESVRREEIVEAARRVWLDTVYFLEPDGTVPSDDDGALGDEEESVARGAEE